MKKQITILLVILVTILEFDHSASAQQYSLEGKWGASLFITGPFGNVPCTIETLYFQNGSYSELVHCVGVTDTLTHQTGTYSIKDKLLFRSVKDWNPKTQWIVDICPDDSSRPGCGHWQELSKPPGGTYEINFLDANQVKYRDINLGGEQVYTRSK